VNFLPILQRELLVQARRPAMHWTRLALAGFFALLVVQHFLGAMLPDPALAGRYAFDGAMALGFVLACGACLLTVDALSGERREGTLGLLLLTPMTVPSVVLGKLAAAGFTVLLALLGLVPALMLPLLAGGVTPAEAARSGLALIVLAWLALAVGLWASAQEHEQPRAIRRAVGWLAGLILVPLLLGWVARATGAGSFFPGPVDALGAGSATAYPVAPARYWINLGGLLAAAAVVLWQAQARLRGQAPDEMPRTTPPPTSRARQLLGNGDPLAWRLRRGGTLIRSLWVAAAALSVGSSAILMQFYSTGFGETWRLLYYAGQWGGADAGGLGGRTVLRRGRPDGGTRIAPHDAGGRAQSAGSASMGAHPGAARAAGAHRLAGGG
jgi:ABC-type transport system involved in cytochrome c biogenesis permease component